MIENLQIFSTAEKLAGQFAGELIGRIAASQSNTFNLAISGGKTPDLLFEALATKYAHFPIWQKLHFWWVDERMVPPTHPESNFGVVNRLLFENISIPASNIHRIKGENNPEEEAISYSEEISKNLCKETEWPVFDLILLGMGDDGHTASIFPNQISLLHSREICAVATHPASGQKRVTLTGPVINNARSVIFMVTGESKSERLYEISFVPEKASGLPAAQIKPKNGKLSWYVDQLAASKIKPI